MTSDCKWELWQVLPRFNRPNSSRSERLLPWLQRRDWCSRRLSQQIHAEIILSALNPTPPTPPSADPPPQRSQRGWKGRVLLHKRGKKKRRRGGGVWKIILKDFPSVLREKSHPNYSITGKNQTLRLSKEGDFSVFSSEIAHAADGNTHTHRPGDTGSRQTGAGGGRKGQQTHPFQGSS